jgi:hypothetical protein
MKICYVELSGEIEGQLHVDLTNNDGYLVVAEQDLDQTCEIASLFRVRYDSALLWQ